jgi:hypothetical protein
LNKNSGKYAATRQGEMLQYWFYGNNCDFVLLLSLIAHANLCRDIVTHSDTAQDDDPVVIENAEEYLTPSWTFYESFSNEATTIWNIVAAPFLKVSKAEIRDFIADDDYDEGSIDDDEVEASGPILSHQALHMQAELAEIRRERDADKKLAAHYEQVVKNLRKEEDDDDLDDRSDDDSAEEDESDHSEDYDPQKGSSDSDDNVDDWQKNILAKRVVKIKSSSPRKLVGRRVSMSSINVSPQKRPITIYSDSENESPLITASSSMVRKRLAIQDSDDDE